MSDIALNNDGDIDVTNSDLSIVEGTDAIAQHISIRLQFFRGEWFLDTRLGIPYYQDVLVKNPDLVVIRGIFREVILETPGVQELVTFDTTFDAATRKLTVTFQALLTTGEILDFSESFIIGD
jgi:hypothetical protein